MKETFPKSSVMIMADMVGYADGGVVSKQVLKNDAGNITLFSFDEGQGLSEHTAPFDALVQNLEGEVEIVLCWAAVAFEERGVGYYAGRSETLPACGHPLQDVADNDKRLTDLRRCRSHPFSYPALSGYEKGRLCFGGLDRMKMVNENRRVR